MSSDPIGLRGGLNTYLYARANPLRYIDPLGLWSNTAGGYEGPGGEWTWGNDSGNGFVTGRVGFGDGGGWSYDPNGGIPGPKINDRCKGGIVLSASVQVNGSIGPFSVNWEGGWGRNYTNEESSGYSSAGPAFSANWSNWRLSLDGSVGGQVTAYSPAQDSCGCKQ